MKITVKADRNNDDSLRYGKITVEYHGDGDKHLFIEQGAGNTSRNYDNMDTLHVTFDQVPALIEALRTIVDLPNTKNPVKNGVYLNDSDNDYWRVLAVSCAYGDKFERDYNDYVTIIRCDDVGKPTDPEITQVWLESDFVASFSFTTIADDTEDEDD